MTTATQTAATVAAQVTDKDRYLFDVHGYFVVRGALSADELAALNECIDRCVSEPTQQQKLVLFTSHAGALGMPGAHREAFADTGFFQWAEGFRSLTDHPRVLPYLKDWLSPSVRLDTCIGTRTIAGFGGQPLHMGGVPDIDWARYDFRGRPSAMLTNVGWALSDVNPGDGGFVCVPGSHKANYPCPPEMLDFGDSAERLDKIDVKAGDAIIFSEALTHGALPWTASHERRVMFYRYMPGHAAWDHLEYPQDLLDTFTPGQRKLIEPSYVRRPVSDNGRPAGQHLRPQAD